jgi:hypothetical protein
MQMYRSYPITVQYKKLTGPGAGLPCEIISLPIITMPARIIKKCIVLIVTLGANPALHPVDSGPTGGDIHSGHT